MRMYGLSRRPVLRLLACLLVAAVTLVPALASADTGGSYQVIKLVSDLPNVAPVQDTNLVNAWGLARSATSPWWVADNGTGVSTLYDGNGTPRPLVVTIPPPAGGASAAPTGIIFNDALAADPNTDEFSVSANGVSGPSRFIFATEDGTISGWNPQVDATNAILAVDRSKAGGGAIYKGLTQGQLRGRDVLFATDFHAGRVEIFDTRFHFIGSFTDPTLARDCNEPACYAPFGIQNIGGRIFVTFALQDADREDDVAGLGNGFVDVFNPDDGRMLTRFASRGVLNSPWGLAQAPENFGMFSGAILVGNFGNGRINAFDPDSGAFLGTLADSAGMPISIDGLWGIAFGNGAAAGGANELFFASGPNDEANGLFGKIQAVSGDN